MGKRMHTTHIFFHPTSLVVICQTLLWSLCSGHYDRPMNLCFRFAWLAIPIAKGHSKTPVATQSVTQTQTLRPGLPDPLSGIDCFGRSQQSKGSALHWSLCLSNISSPHVILAHHLEQKMQNLVAFSCEKNAQNICWRFAYTKNAKK